MKKLLAGLMVLVFLFIGTQQAYASIFRDDGCSNGEVYSSTTGQRCPTSNRSVTVLSPNGGETYEAGDRVTIRWKTMNAYNPNTQVSIMDDRIPDWQTLSLFGSAPALDYAKYVSASGNGGNTEYTYEYKFTVPSTFNDSLPSQYQNIYGGKHYKILVNIVVPGQVGIASKQILEDLSNNTFTINPPDQKVSVDLKVNGSDNPSVITLGSTVKVSWSAKSNGQSIVCYPFGHNIGGWTEYGALPATGSKNLEARIYNYIDNLASFKVGINCNGVEDFVQLPITTSATPSITVLSPNGGESYKAGDKITVKWKTENIPSNAFMQIAAYRINSNNTPYQSFNTYPDNAIHDIAGAPDNMTLNDGSEKIFVDFPQDYSTGTDFKIYVRRILYDQLTQRVTDDSLLDWSNNYFTINSATDDGCSNGEVYRSNSASGPRCPREGDPVISGVSGPQSLGVNQTGTWTVSASNRNGGNLSYSVDWRDMQPTVSAHPNLSQQQTATFTHPYEQPGVYTPIFTVTNSNGQSAKTSLSVIVGDSAFPLPLGCTSSQGYSPVTGMKCDGLQNVITDPGCLPGYNFSRTTGQACTDTIYTYTTHRILKLTNPRMTGEDVKVLQRFLVLYADGVYGSGTMAMVAEWQLDHGLTPDGVFGPESRRIAGLD